MRTPFIRFIGLIALAASAAQVAAAQAASPSSAGALPPVRTLGKMVARSAELLGAVSQVRALADGRVLVNDNLGRKVVLFDNGLTAFSIVADTTSATANAYSSRAAGLIAYRGDSTLFVDPQSLSMLVIDGRGVVARVMSLPRPSDANQLIGGPGGTPGFDAQGRLVYRTVPELRMGHGGGMPPLPDSMTVVRIDLESRKVDTVANVKIPKTRISTSQSMGISFIQNPMQYVDDWAVTSDGRVAIVRGQEYRVEFFDGAGNVDLSVALPFAWRQLNDSMKVAFLDSTKAAMDKLYERAQQAGGAAPITLGGDGGGLIPAEAAMIMSEHVAGRGAAAAGATNAPARGGGGRQGVLARPQFVQASELSDYAPPFTTGAVRGDADGNLWIRTSTVYDGGSVYDVVNGKGQLTDRVLLPPGRVVAGFAPGIVYMGFRDGFGVRLEAAFTRDGSVLRP